MYFSEENMASAQRKRTIRCGWLKKQGGMVRTWHRRWFCLNNDFLFYFAKEDDSRPLGCIFLPGNRVSEVPFNPDEPEKCLFEISAGMRHVFILCIPLCTEICSVKNSYWLTIVRQATVSLTLKIFLFSHLYIHPLLMFTFIAHIDT